MPGPRPVPVEDRFWQKVDKADANARRAVPRISAAGRRKSITHNQEG
jgi:hypothetical protein